MGGKLMIVEHATVGHSESIGSGTRIYRYTADETNKKKYQWQVSFHGRVDGYNGSFAKVRKNAVKCE
jgi:hypothetical protein